MWIVKIAVLTNETIELVNQITSQLESKKSVAGKRAVPRQMCVIELKGRALQFSGVTMQDEPSR